MNLWDMAVGLIIVGFGIIGLVNGFIYSVFKIASFFASIIISISFYPRVAEILMKSALYINIKASILKNLLLQKGDIAVNSGLGGAAGSATTDSVVQHLKLPGFIKESMLDNLSRTLDPAKLFDISGIMDAVSGELAKVVISVISLILLFILVRIGLVFLKFILKGIAKLPVFKQMDKLGGFALGAVEGLLSIYVVFTVLMLFNASPAFKPVFEELDRSTVALFLYQHNFIMGWAFPVH